MLLEKLNIVKIFFGMLLSVCVFQYGLCQNVAPFYIEKSLPKGYVKDGSVDYTKEIQASLNSHRHVIFPNFPVLINDKGLKIKSNSKIEFQPKSLVSLKPSRKGSYNIFDLVYVENIELLNLKIVGDRDKHLGQEGADGNGISIRGSRNIKVINPIVEKCWGDGIIIGGLTRHNKEGRYVPCDNIVISGGILNNNRRNGLSIMSAKNTLVENLEANNTKGAFPMAGIDIEPNFNKDYMDNVVLRNIVTRNNRYGIQVVLKKLVGEKKVNVGVLIDNHVDYKSQMGLRFDKIDRKGTALEGGVKVVNSRWVDNKHHGIIFEDSQDNSCEVTLQNVRTLKNNREETLDLDHLRSKVKILR